MACVPGSGGFPGNGVSLMWMESFNAEELMRVVRPAIDRGAADEIAREVARRWSPPQLCPMLHDADPVNRQVAALVLGLIGTGDQIEELAASLRDPDDAVNHLAEHAMWSIWFRNGSPRAQRLFQRGIQAMEQGDPAEAVELLTDARRIDAKFAEAYHQAALAHYMLEEYDEAVGEALLCVELEPLHFGALATLGHAHAHLNDLPAAAMYYRKALTVNPTLEAIAGALDRINAASGS